MSFNRWVLATPWLIFGIGVGLYFQSENEVWTQFDRAQTSWRRGDYEQAMKLYERVYRLYPDSSYAGRALFELGSLNYINSYNINRAVEAFQRLVTEYPSSPKVVDAYMMLGEINEIELQDLPAAIDCWRRLLDMDLPSDLRRQLLFRIGNAYFKLDQFERARRTFEELLDENDDLAQQANIRLGTIFQLTRDYQDSLPCFEAVLRGESRASYRLQAQLGLIESYEFLADLDAAIAVAESVNDADYPADLKRDLLERLGNKRKFYESKLWESGHN